MECVRRISTRALILILIISMFAYFGTYQADAASAGTISKLTNVEDGIQVKWTKNTAKSGYKIYRKAGSATKWTLVKTVKSKTTTSWTDSKVTNGTKYRYRVRAYKGSKIASTTKYLTTYRLTVAKIESLKSEKPGAITVTGSKNSKATGYQIRYGTDKDFDSSTSKYISGTQLDRTITGLKQDKTYYVKIRAYKKVNDVKYYGPYSDVSSVKVAVEDNNPQGQLGSGVLDNYQEEILEEAYRIYNRGNTVYQRSGRGEQNEEGKYEYDCSGFASSVINTVMQRHCPLYKITASCKDLYGTGCIYNKGLRGEFSAYTVCSGEWDATKVEPGDLIFFNSTGTTALNHVGIYLGKSKFMHSTDYKIDGVGISDMEGDYEKRFRSAIRFYPDCVTPAEQTFKVKTSGAKNVSEKAASISEDNQKVGTISYGDTVTVLYTNASESYAYIRFGNNKTGYIYDPWEKLDK